MPRLEGMHAPRNEFAHLLRPAGFNLPFTPDVFRFNRVSPYYPADPCIRPNEADLICPLEYPPCPKNQQCVPMAGTDVRMPGDVYRFFKVQMAGSGLPCREVMSSSCTFGNWKPRCPPQYKPRYPPSKPGRHFDYRYPSGATECNSTAHRHGHVPEKCRVTYPGADEVICLEEPQPSDCGICPYGECNCDGQGRLVDYNSSKPSYNIPSEMSNNSRICNPSMYNNPPISSVHGISGDSTSSYQPCGSSIGNIAIPPVHHGRDNGAPCPQCTHSYFQTNYVCRPVFDRTYLLDCPEQDGPPADTYTFL